VGEGAFGEVFMLPNHIDKDPPVVKIVPVEGSALVNGHPQTKLADMLGEIIISTELSKLAQNCLDTVAHGFVPVHRCNLTAGVYPDMLLEKWDVFHKEKTSENDRPDQDLFKDQVEPQKFVVLELGNGGKDLENIVLYNAAQGLAIFEQVAHAIAMAEQEFMFEHRDLHWGNIVVRECVKKHIVFQHGLHQFQVDTMGVPATIFEPNDFVK
jgi:serine/threonine-protein kinase haspin